MKIKITKTPAPFEIRDSVYDKIAFLAEKFGVSEAEYRKKLPIIYMTNDIVPSSHVYDWDKNEILVSRESEKIAEEDTEKALVDNGSQFLRALYHPHTVFTHAFFGILGYILWSGIVPKPEEGDNYLKSADIVFESFREDYKKEHKEAVRVHEQLSRQEEILMESILPSVYRGDMGEALKELKKSRTDFGENYQALLDVVKIGDPMLIDKAITQLQGIIIDVEYARDLSKRNSDKTSEPIIDATKKGAYAALKHGLQALDDNPDLIRLPGDKIELTLEKYTDAGSVQSD